MYETFLGWLETPLLVAVVIALLAYFVSRGLLSVASSTFRRTGLRDDAYTDFSWRQFKRRDYVEIPVGKGNEKIVLFRDAKDYAYNAFRQDPAKWKLDSRVENSTKWQNQVAYEAADALQQLGLAVFTGSVELEAILANLADTIIDDWVISLSWIDTHRLKSNTKKIMPPNYIVHYSRRHAEWLFWVAIAFMRFSNWPLDGTLASENEEFIGMTDKELRARIVALSNADRNLLPSSVRRSVNRATGLSISA